MWGVEDGCGLCDSRGCVWDERQWDVAVWEVGSWGAGGGGGKGRQVGVEGREGRWGWRGGRRVKIGVTSNLA